MMSSTAASWSTTGRLHRRGMKGVVRLSGVEALKKLQAKSFGSAQGDKPKLTNLLNTILLYEL